MSSEDRRGLRIALTFTIAFVVAELLRLDLQLTFLAPLVAGTLAAGPAIGAGLLVALPIVAWVLVAGAGVAVQFLANQPLVFCLLGLWIYFGGFKLLADPQKATLGLIVLIVFTIVPQTLIKAPELSGDLAYWFFVNFAIAAASAGVMRRLLPDPQIGAAAARPPQLPPLVAALALLLSVILSAMIKPPAPGAVMIGIIITLRADGETAANVVRDRFAAAVLGGAMAVLVWEVLWLAPTLPVLATVVLLAAWPFARVFAGGGPYAAMALKSMNVLAILMGEGFSVFYADADDRIWTRLGGVVVGLTYVSAVLALTRCFAGTGDRDRLRQAGLRRQRG